MGTKRPVAPRGETHITLNIENTPYKIQQFVKDCEKLYCNATVIELENSDESKSLQVMATTPYFEKGPMIVAVFSLTELGYYVNRTKIELEFDPQHHVKSDDHLYYEGHIRMILPIWFKRQTIQGYCDDLKFRFSRNALKKEGATYEQYITYRGYGDTPTEFQLVMLHMQNVLKQHGIKYDKVHLEECIHDDNPVMDSKWMPGLIDEKS